MKINKFYLIIVLFTLMIISSCISNKTFKQNIFIKEQPEYICNKTDSFSVVYPGDYIFKNKISYKDYNFYKNCIEQIFPDIKITKNDFVFFGITKDPNFKSALFICNTEKYCNKYIKNLDSIYIKGVKNYICSVKNKDKLSILIVNPYNISSNDLYRPISFYNSNLTIGEYSDIFESLKINDSTEYFSPENPFIIANKSIDLKKTLNYLLPIVILHKNANNYTHSSFSLQNQFIQSSLTYNSFVENAKEQNVFIKKYNQPRFNYYSKIFEKNDFITSEKEVYSIIYKRIKNENLVIFNESHWLPKHRYFVSSFLDSLYNIGFRYLALETIDEKSEEDINTTKLITSNSGFYSIEPQYAQLVRKALGLGFKIIAYEDTTYSKNRDSIQVENIYKKTFLLDKNTKVLVLAGFAHVNENSKANKLGYLFDKFHQINPLSIEQTELESLTMSFDEKIAILSNESKEKELSIKSDIYVLNNFKNTDYCKFLTKRKNAISIEIGELKFKLKSKYNKNDNYLCSIYLKKEWDIVKNAIPLANYCINEKYLPTLYFDLNEKYVIVIKNLMGDILLVKESYKPQ